MARSLQRVQRTTTSNDWSWAEWVRSHREAEPPCAHYGRLLPAPRPGGSGVSEFQAGAGDVRCGPAAAGRVCSSRAVIRVRSLASA